MKTQLRVLAVILFLIMVFTTSAQVSQVQYEVIYNPASCLYEAHAHVIGASLTFPSTIPFPSKFTVVVPASISNSPLIVTQNVNPPGLAWSQSNSIYAPAAAINSDFHAFTISGGGGSNAYPVFTVGTDILLFKFSVPHVGCEEGVRCFINGTDPNSGQPGMAGIDFTQCFKTAQAGVPSGVDHYQSNIGSPISLPHPTASSSDAFSCNGNTLYLSSAGTTTLGCNNSLTYGWVGSDGFSSSLQNPVVSPYTAPGTYTVTIKDHNGCTNTSSVVLTGPFQALTAVTSATQPNCAGSSTGTATVIGSGGTPGYSYLWTNGQTTATINNLAAGNYPVTITDNNNCTSTGIATVTDPAAWSINITGPAQVTSGQANAQYCTVFETGHIYSWTVNGGSIASGQGTSCITVTWGPYPACGCGSVSVLESFNGCTGTANYPVTIIQTTNVNISGYVLYDNSPGEGVNGVTIQLRNSSDVILDTTVTINNPSSSQSGYYAFSNIPDGTGYKLSGNYNGSWGGNNATDDLIVQMNTIGTYPLNGLNAVVADVNATSTITALDALYITLRSVGSITSYPAGDWKISEQTVSLSGTPVTLDLVVLCVGDVNGSYNVNGSKEATSLSAIEDGLITVPVNVPFVYNIHSSRNADLGAMTLFMGYDNNRYEVADIVSPQDGMKYMIADGKISVAWADTKPLKVNTDDVLLSLNMKAKEKISEPSAVFSIKPGSEFADMQARPYDNFDLKMANVKTHDGSQDITMSNYPNPFVNTTTIVYTLPESGHVILVLADLYGKTVRTLADRQEIAGSHSITVDPAALNMIPGVYLYKIIFDSAADTYQQVNKMVFTR